MGVSESVHFMQCMTFLTPSWCQSTAGRLLYCIFSQSSPRVFWHRPKAIRWEVSISAGSLHQPKKAQTRRSSCTTSRWWSNKWWGRIGHGAFLWLHCPKGKLDNTLWPCCLAKEKNTPMRWKMQWERERERWGVFCWLLVLSSMKTSGATDSLDDWNYWVESNDHTRGPMKMTWTRWEQGELEITWLLDVPSRQKILQKLCCFFPIFLSRPNPPSHQPQESLRNYQLLTITTLSQIALPPPHMAVHRPPLWFFFGGFKSLCNVVFFFSRCSFLGDVVICPQGVGSFSSGQEVRQVVFWVRFRAQTGKPLQHGGHGEAVPKNRAVVLRQSMASWVKLTYLSNLGFEKFVSRTMMNFGNTRQYFDKLIVVDCRVCKVGCFFALALSYCFQEHARYRG